MQIAEESDSIEVRRVTEFLSSTPANSDVNGFEKNSPRVSRIQVYTYLNFLLNLNQHTKHSRLSIYAYLTNVITNEKK